MNPFGRVEDTSKVGYCRILSFQISRNNVSEFTTMLETELAASEARFSKVFDASPSLISITVLESSQLYAVNQAWLNVTGYSRDEVIGKTALELKLWADPNQRAHFIETFRKTKKMRNYELQMRSKAGEVRSYIASGEEIEYDGQPCLMLAFSDITERRQAEEVLRLSHDELERKVAERTQELQDAKAELEDSELRLMQVNRMLNSVLDNIPVRVFWKDLDLNIIGCNRPYAMDAGFQNPRQVVGKSDFDMVWHDQAEVNRATDRAVIKTNQPHHGYEESYINPDGRETWRRKSKSPLRDLDGHVVGVLGIYEDITQRRTAEKELERAKSEAERANQAKSQFLSSMSHELRTPLNAILGFAQLLEYDPRHPLLDAQKESVEHIKTGGDHLLNLINEVLELAKIEAGHVDLKIESVNPQDVFYETVPMAQSLAENRGLTFHVPVLTGCWPNIRVDALRLKQVLLNLLSNAVKYNVDGGEFTLDCKEVDGSLKIIVSDTGRGISPQGLEYLFQPFNRLGHENSNIEGTGIGLTITKQLVEHMGGQIGVESPPRQRHNFLRGLSTFW